MRHKRGCVMLMASSSPHTKGGEMIHKPNAENTKVQTLAIAAVRLTNGMVSDDHRCDII
jgi:hypothetical protein